MAPPSDDAFPRDTYATYKRATAYFLRWLLRAGAAVLSVEPQDPARSPPHPPRGSLELYEQIVAAIAADATALPVALRALYPLALEACESAITLRTRVALVLAEAADAAHAYFLARLTQWRDTLAAVVTSPTRPSGQPTRGGKQYPRRECEVVDFSNYYDVLALPDDYFADDTGTETIAAAARPSVAVLSAAEEKRLFDEAFAQDLNAELACLLMELEELSEGVYAAFHAVKRATKTLVEATTVAKVAIDCAASVIAKLQLRYPAIKSGEDMCMLIQDRMSVTELGRLVSRVGVAWMPSANADEIRYQYVPGTLLVDLLWVGKALSTFAATVRGRSRVRISMKPAHYGDRYSEEKTPHYTV